MLALGPARLRSGTAQAVEALQGSDQALHRLWRPCKAPIRRRLGLGLYLGPEAGAGTGRGKDRGRGRGRGSFLGQLGRTCGQGSPGGCRTEGCGMGGYRAYWRVRDHAVWSWGAWQGTRPCCVELGRMVGWRCYMS